MSQASMSESRLERETRRSPKSWASKKALNLKQNITAEESIEQGFLTAAFTIEYLQQMNSASPAIIAKDGDKLVGYALVATKEIRKGHDLLEGLFDAIDECEYNGKLLREVNYVVVG